MKLKEINLQLFGRKNILGIDEEDDTLKRRGDGLGTGMVGTSYRPQVTTTVNRATPTGYRSVLDQNVGSENVLGNAALQMQRQTVQNPTTLSANNTSALGSGGTYGVAELDRVGAFDDKIYPYYTESKNVADYKNALSNLATPTYGYTYTPYNRSKFAYDDFSYDPDTDVSYQSYARQYSRNGQNAYRDTLGKLAASTGGIGSSYAASMSQQAYNNYMQQLADKVPELEQLARSMYDTDRNFAYNLWDTEESAKESQWNAYQNSLANAAKYKYEQDLDNYENAVSALKAKYGITDTDTEEDTSVDYGDKYDDVLANAKTYASNGEYGKIKSYLESEVNRGRLTPAGMEDIYEREFGGDVGIGNSAKSYGRVKTEEANAAYKTQQEEQATKENSAKFLSIYNQIAAVKNDNTRARDARKAISDNPWMTQEQIDYLLKLI